VQIFEGRGDTSEMPLITGHERRRSLYDRRGEWHRVTKMNDLRALRRAAGLGQREFAALLSVPLETLRTWDSGRRQIPAPMLQRARAAIADHARQTDLLPLAQLANEFHVHLRTLQAAVRTGRLDAHFSVKSVLGRPRRLATRPAVEQFMVTHDRRFGGQKACPAPLPTVPPDYDQQIRALRRRLRLTQAGLAKHIGAAGKAVIYQWESRTRTPSPVSWGRLLRLDRCGPSPARGWLASGMRSHRQALGYPHPAGVPISGELY
jgi:DNA-binding transcriptional regulator YiaG